MSCGVGRRRGSDLAWLWLWCRQVATALIRPLAWELPYAVGAAQEMIKRQKKKVKKTAETYYLAITKTIVFGVPIVAQWLTNWTRNHEVVGSIPGLAQWVKDLALP